MVINRTDIVAQCYWAIGVSRNVGHLYQRITQLHVCQHGTGLLKPETLNVLYIAIRDPRPNPWSIGISIVKMYRPSITNNCNGCRVVSVIVTEHELCWSLSERELFYICFEDFIFMCHKMTLMWTILNALRLRKLWTGKWLCRFEWLNMPIENKNLRLCNYMHICREC